MCTLNQCGKFSSVTALIRNHFGCAGQEIGTAFLHLACNETFMSHGDNCKLCLIFVFRAIHILNIYKMMKALHCKQRCSSNLIHTLQPFFINLEQTH